MKLEKLADRLDVLMQDPSDTETLQHILRMIGDELPRYRKDILDETRARLVVAASALIVRKGNPHATITAFQLLATATVVTAYQAAATERHCTVCDNPLIDHFVLEVGEGNPPRFRICDECIEGAIERVRPDAVPVFQTARELRAAKKEDAGPLNLFLGESVTDPALPVITVISATHRRSK